MNFAASDLDDLADGHRFVAAEIQNSFQNEVGIQAGGSECGRVAGFEGQRQKDASVERAVVVGITRQNEAMGQCFGIVRVRFSHLRR